MGSVSVNPPKSPVTEGSMGVAAATVPNVCKMPGPPAPFVPVPLPNIGKSGDSPKDYSKKVTIEGKKVAIKGATFGSMGDVASKGTGGGLVSANTHGPTKFVGPGSLDVKIEGKNVQLLGDPMLNDCGGGGSPPNSATVVGVLQGPGLAAVFGDEPCPLCGKAHEEKLEEDDDTKDAADKLADAANAAVDEAKVERERRIAQAQAQADAAHAQAIAAAELELTAVEADPEASKSAIKKARAKVEDLKKKKPKVSGPKAAAITAMLGVVKCKKCKHIHAGFSMEQYSDVQAKLSAAWHSPTAYNNVLGDSTGSSIPTLAKFLPHVKNQEKFTEKWNHCIAQRAKYNSPSDPLDECFFPPGQCAAQQMVLLAMDHGCRPIGLTERWYKSGKPDAPFEGDVYVRDLGDDGRPGPPRKAPKGEFGGKKAIPPCGTCQVILAALMCAEEQPPTCDYKAPKKQVCTCTP
jgi:hypothetical protein